MRISLLGFGCGAVGGLMVRGDPADQERAIARALEAGVNYFDTAVQYGNGASEQNLGHILKKLKPADAIIGTKVRLAPGNLDRIGDAVTSSLEDSLQRLDRERVDILYLHDPISAAGGAESISSRQALEEVVPAFERLRRQGKARFLGFTAIGETDSLKEVMGSRAFDGAQITYNLLNPTAATPLPANYPAQDYDRLLDHAQAAGIGVVVIRVLAGGALSGSSARHPIASPPPTPIGSGQSYEADVARARKLMPLVEEGHAASLPEAAIRFAISHAAVSTILVGMATPEQFEQALVAVQHGPLPQSALDRLTQLQHSFVGHGDRA
jgi:aryl-alcohol dehydrogenase-like predicted oxidoreductase